MGHPICSGIPQQSEFVQEQFSLDPMPIGYTLVPIMAGARTTLTVEESGRAFGEKILAGIEPALTD